MFSYNSYLLLGELAKSGVNIPFLIEHGYELCKCNYSLQREIDYKGQVQSKSNGGTFDIAMMGVPSNEIIEWGVNPRSYKNGSIIFCNSEGLVVERIDFEKAACIDIDLTYIRTGSRYTNCELSLTAEIIKIGNITLNNYWLNA